MTDTQWPRFEVFLTEDEGKPAAHVGSVHASDPEIALLNARDVFVRRPQCRDLWVAPAGRVLFRTAEELRSQPVPEESNDKTENLYLVFCKRSHREPLVFIGHRAARSEKAALADAVQEISLPEPTLWAVVSDQAVIRSQAQERASFFTPAETKDYKQHVRYPVARLIKEIQGK